MYSPLKILVCVALICVPAISTNGRNQRKRRDVIDLRPTLPYEWQATNNWGPRTSPNDVETLRIGIHNQNLNGGNYQGSRLENSQRSSSEFNLQKLQSGDNINPSFISENSREQLLNGGKRFSSSIGYVPSSFSEARRSNSGIQYGQRQSQFLDGLRNQQNFQEIGVNAVEPSVGSGRIPLIRNYNSNTIQEERPGILINSINPSAYGRLNGQQARNINSGRVDGFNQNILGGERSLGETIQSSPSEISAYQPNQFNIGITSELLKGGRSGQITTRSNLLREGNDVSGQNRNEVYQETENVTQNTDNIRFPIQNILSTGKSESSFQPQIGRYSTQFGINQIRGIQGELGHNGRQQLLHAGLNGRRLSSTQGNAGNNVALLQEAVQEARPELRANSESNLNSFQPQRNRNQVSVSQQQQPNIYSYGELSAKILKVIQSNPAMLSNMNGLMEQLQNNEESGNEQIRKLKSLLQEIGTYTGNPSSSDRNINGQRQQKPLIRNLLEVMDRSQNNQIDSYIPTSYFNFRSL